MATNKIQPNREMQIPDLLDSILEILLSLCVPCLFAQKLIRTVCGMKIHEHMQIFRDTHATWILLCVLQFFLRPRLRHVLLNTPYCISVYYSNCYLTSQRFWKNISFNSTRNCIPTFDPWCICLSDAVGRKTPPESVFTPKIWSTPLLHCNMLFFPFHVVFVLPTFIKGIHI